MIVLYWNVRDIGNSGTKITLNSFYLSHKPVVIFLAKPMINFVQVPSWYWHGIGVTKSCTNDRGNMLPHFGLFGEMM